MKSKMSLIACVAIILSSCNKMPIEKRSVDKAEAWSQTSADANNTDITIPPILLPILPILPDPAPILPPGQTEYCIPNQAEFYNYVWALPYGPAALCPYTSYALKTANVTFTDGSTIFCGPVPVNRFWTGYGGIALQDISCNQATGGFLSYIVITYYESSGSQATATFPLYSCDYNAIGYPIGYSEIRMLKAGITYILHSTVTSFSYPVSGTMVTKKIKLIEFI